MGSSLVWILLKSNAPHYYRFSRQRRKTGGWGKAPIEVFETTPFPTEETLLFLYKQGARKGHFRYFAEKDRGPNPQDPLVAHMPCQ